MTSDGLIMFDGCDFEKYTGDQTFSTLTLVYDTKGRRMHIYDGPNHFVEFQNFPEAVASFILNTSEPVDFTYSIGPCSPESIP